MNRKPDHDPKSSENGVTNSCPADLVCRLSDQKQAKPEEFTLMNSLMLVTQRMC